MSDLIDRQAAIDAMSESLKRVFPEHRQIAEKCLNVLPSAQEKPFNLPEIYIADGYDTIEGEDGNVGFGVYVPDETKIYVAGDVEGEIRARTLFHEVCHWVQAMCGRPFDEDEANEFSDIVYDALPSAQPNLQQTCNQLATDCISRQAAIDALDTGLWGAEWDKALATAMLKDLPPVQPKLKTGQWISVSERLPEIRQDVLCQCRGNNYSVLRLNQDSDWECIYPHTTYMQSFVIAWMPLPEPYEPQESEGKE